MSVPSGSGAAPSTSQKSHVRYPHTIIKTYDYTLTAPAYPSGFSPYCPEVNLVVWNPGPPPSDPNRSRSSAARSRSSTSGAATPRRVTTSTCSWKSTYGNMRFISKTGAFSLDSVDDSGALLTVSDYTTGDSSNYEVYLSW